MRLAYSARALRDVNRLTDFLHESMPEVAEATGALIFEAIDILQHHPLIGRPITARLRELVISRGRSGYLALYHVDRDGDRILIVAIRHQRESGYHDDEL
ncbi:addiction module toxin RelE [Xenophilus aerolatus]|nr:addiction module toxin RelE [Xenophilus aerolatus]